MSRNMRGSLDICADCSSPGMHYGYSTVFSFAYVILFADPSWASINRGVLICGDCCGVHRTLGRHISHVKSLNKGQWIPAQLAVSFFTLLYCFINQAPGLFLTTNCSVVHLFNFQMVKQLASLGANGIWEYTLLEPGHSKKKNKPTPREPTQ